MYRLPYPGRSGSPDSGPFPTPGRTRLASLGLGLLLFILASSLHAREDFEPDNCFEQQGRPHIWNLCDYYQDKRLRQAVDDYLPEALEKLDAERFELSPYSGESDEVLDADGL